jgi:hypothetical protein
MSEKQPPSPPVRGGIVRPLGVKQGETPEMYFKRIAREQEAAIEAMQESTMMNVSARAVQRSVVDVDGNEANPQSKEYNDRNKRAIDALKLLQRGRASTVDRTFDALNQMKIPAVEAAFPHIRDVMFGLDNLENMTIEEFFEKFEFVKPANFETLQPNQKAEIQAKFIECLERWIKEAIAASINSITAIPKAIYELGFGNPFALAGAVGANIFFQWSAQNVLSSVGERVIGAISFNKYTLGQVTESFKALLRLSDPAEIVKGLDQLLQNYGVSDENLRKAYIDCIKTYSLEQLYTVISTLSVTTLRLGFGTNILSAGINGFFDRAGTLINPNLDPQTEARLNSLLPNHPGPLRDMANYSIEILRILKRAFACVCNTSASIVSQSILGVCGTVMFLRAPSGQGSYDRLLRIVSNVSTAIGTKAVDRASSISPGDKRHYEIVQLLFSFIGLKLSDDERKNQNTVRYFRMNTTARMLKILISKKPGMKETVSLFLDRECSEYLYGCIGEDEHRLPKMDTFTIVLQSLTVLESDLTTTAVDALSKNYKAFSRAETAFHTPSQASLDIAIDVMNQADSMLEHLRSQASEITGFEMEDVGVVIGEGIQGIAVASRLEDLEASSIEVRKREIVKRNIAHHAAMISITFEEGINRLSEPDQVVAMDNYSEDINDAGTRIVDALYSGEKDHDPKIATFIDFLVDQEKPEPELLREIGDAISTVTKAVIDKAPDSVDNARIAGAAVGSAGRTFVNGACSALTTVVGAPVFVGKGLFNLGKRLFYSVISGAAAPDVNDQLQANYNGIAGAAAAVVNNPADSKPKVDNLVHSLQPDIAAAATGSKRGRNDLEKAEAAGAAAAVANEGVAALAIAISDASRGDAAAAGRIDSDAAQGGGGRSRSRKRSASKRTRHRKGVAKKQKSKKNKRQSRRKVRRSSSRKAGRK